LKRILVHGFGSIGRRHFEIIQALCPRAELAVLSEHGSHQQYRGASFQLFTDRSAASQFQPEAVVVANAAVAHVESASHWVEAGAHVLVEKPLAVGLAGTDALARLAEQRGRVVQVGYNLRHTQALSLMQHWVSGGKLGRLVCVHAQVGQNLRTWRPGAQAEHTVSAQKSLGGGALLELSHEIDYVQWLCGSARWVSAHLFQLGDWALDVEDTAHLVLGLGSDGACIASVNLDFVRHDATRICTIIGTEGSLRWDGVQSQLSIYRASAAVWEPINLDASERNTSYQAQWLAFVRACTAGQEAPVSLADGQRVLAVVEAARASSELGGQRVEVTCNTADARNQVI
jgi:predicted dehydrogenase